MYDGSREGVANNSWVRYRGDHMIYFIEWVDVSLNNGTGNNVSLPSFAQTYEWPA